MREDKEVAIRTALLAVAFAFASVTAAPAASKDLPAEWDGLVKVKAKRVDTAYLLPGADFREYKKIILDQTEVAVDKNWQKDYNRSSFSSGKRISDSDVQELIAAVQGGFHDVFVKSFGKAGYEVVTTPGPDVMRIRPAVINVRVNAPDTMSAGMTRTYSREAGSATMVLELRDSVTNAVLGRAIDSREIGNDFLQIRNSATNRSDFEMEFRSWAEACLKGLEELKANSPVTAANAAAK